jgi:tol-pal system protein YbgF
VDLREDVRQVQAENRKLKEADAELRKRLDEQERILKTADWATKQDAQEIRTRQQRFDQRLGDLGKQEDETSRRVESLTARLEEFEAKLSAKATGRDPKSDASGKPSRPGGLEASPALTPTAAYNLAYGDYLKGNYDLAVAGFEDFLKKFPATSLTAHAQYWTGEAYFNKKQYRPAIEAYKRVLDNHPTNDKVSAAMLKTGLAYAELGDVAKAREFFNKVIEKHPQSNEANAAKQRLANLR